MVAPVLLAVDVAASLVASGVDATTRLAEDNRVELLVLLEPWTPTMAILDVTDLTMALIDKQGTEPRVVNGPVDPCVETCDDAGCLTGAVWSWVLRWRGTQV
jgi:hypothetical protein